MHKHHPVQTYQKVLASVGFVVCMAFASIASALFDAGHHAIGTAAAGPFLGLMAAFGTWLARACFKGYRELILGKAEQGSRRYLDAIPAAGMIAIAAIITGLCWFSGSDLPPYFFMTFAAGGLVHELGMAPVINEAYGINMLSRMRRSTTVLPMKCTRRGSSRPTGSCSLPPRHAQAMERGSGRIPSGGQLWTWQPSSTRSQPTSR